MPSWSRPAPALPPKRGLSVEVVREFAPSIPMLGVCLGHQSMGEAFGARVVRAPVSGPRQDQPGAA